MKIRINPPRPQWDDLVRRDLPDDGDVAGSVERIMARVRREGDAALLGLASEIDGVELRSLQVTHAEMAAADGVDEGLKEAIREAAANIEKFHRAQLPAGVDMETAPGVRCLQRPVAIEKVGLYVPGGSAPLFSTVLMLAIPARVAGCGEVVLCTPPSRDGSVAPEILFAASLCGVRKIFKAGGAQAIAAMAYGTQSIPRVDKIFGPGNRYVTKAKQLVSIDRTAIDIPAGPSEVMVLADASAVPAFVASDMLSQAEHGGDSQAVLVASDEALANRVIKEIEAQLLRLSRGDATRKALKNSSIIVLPGEAEMIAFANLYAAEHLIISTSEPWKTAAGIVNAGSIFIGNYTPESAGDYASGTNHTLPTSGWARAVSGVNVDSFLKKITIQEISPEGLRRLGGTIVAMAGAEGLDAHANAVKIRLEALDGM